MKRHYLLFTNQIITLFISVYMRELPVWIWEYSRLQPTGAISNPTSGLALAPHKYVRVHPSRTGCPYSCVMELWVPALGHSSRLSQFVEKYEISKMWTQTRFRIWISRTGALQWMPRNSSQYLATPVAFFVFHSWKRRSSTFRGFPRGSVAVWRQIDSGSFFGGTTTWQDELWRSGGGGGVLIRWCLTVFTVICGECVWKKIWEDKVPLWFSRINCCQRWTFLGHHLILIWTNFPPGMRVNPIILYSIHSIQLITYSTLFISLNSSICLQYFLVNAWSETRQPQLLL